MGKKELILELKELLIMAKAQNDVRSAIDCLHMIQLVQSDSLL